MIFYRTLWRRLTHVPTQLSGKTFGCCCQQKEYTFHRSVCYNEFYRD